MALDGGKDLLADHMSVIARPAPDHGIEHADQLSDCDLLVVFDDCSNLLQKGLNVLLGRLDEQLAVVLTYILAQKIKPILNMRDAGLLLWEFQPARVQKCFEQRQDFVFELLLWASRDDEVIGISDQMLSDN
jgi:hypothetical protein